MAEKSKRSQKDSSSASRKKDNTRKSLRLVDRSETNVRQWLEQNGQYSSALPGQTEEFVICAELLLLLGDHLGVVFASYEMLSWSPPTPFARRK